MTATINSQAYFERIAGDWDRLRTGYFDDSVREAALAHAYLRPEDVVADVGSGTGYVAAALAPRVARVIALDPSPAMLEVAQRNLSAFSNVTYQVTDGVTLPLADASVDAVFANMVLHHCPDPAAAIAEMARVLRPGGRLVLTDMDKHDHDWMRAEMADLWLGFERAEVKGWLREADLVNLIVTKASKCRSESESNAAARAEVDVFVATGSRRVSGVTGAVQAAYGAAAEAVTASEGEVPAGDTQSGITCCASTGAPAGAYTADISLSSSTCCAGTSAMDAIGDGGKFVWNTEYGADQLGSAPAEAAEISLGCGNPGAIAALQPGETALDIGSGGGIDVFLAAGRVGPTGKGIGVDMTPAMLARARATAARAGISNVEFREGQADALPVADAEVDVVMSNCVINLCDDKGKVFEEAFRVLRPGGRLAISDMVTDGPLPRALFAESGGWSGCVQGALPEAEYLALVRAAGFTDVQAQRSRSGGELDGVRVFSLSVTARK